MPSPAPVTIDQIQLDLDADRRWRERRHQQWTENYQLYRDTVITNRLTQRQSVNVPLMKATIRTLLSRANEPADVELEDYDNDGQRELLVNAYLDKVYEDNKYELLDVVDKKNVGLYGRSWTKLNILDGFLRITIHDPFDVLIDRYALPWDIDKTARRITHVGLYRSLSDLELNPIYDKAAIGRLRTFFATKQGLVIAGQNSQIVADRARRLEEMGAQDVQYPLLSETYVELNEQQRKVWHPDEQQDVIHVIVTANGSEILMDKPLRELLGVNFFLWSGWTDDPEATDIYSDGTADIVRVPNQILNVYFSQLVENGVLRGYGMNFYDSSAKEGWSPIGYVPSPWGFYPVPGDPNKVIKHIEVPELASHLTEMEMITGMVESATAASAIEKGDTPEGAQTLGEINLMVAKADERMKDVPKFARIHAKQLGDKLAKLINAAAAKGLLKPVTLYKKSAAGSYYARTIDPKELVAPNGYNCVVTLKAQKEADSLKEIQKLKLGAAQFPMNLPLQEILSDRMLSWLELTPDEKKRVQDYAAQNPMSMLPPPTAAPGASAPSAPVASTRQPVNA